jgi:hypothetical protein
MTALSCTQSKDCEAVKKSTDLTDEGSPRKPRRLAISFEG